MRRSLSAIHVVALGIWLGALVASALLAKTLFDLAKPVCPGCLLRTEKDQPLLACATCGALHHAGCAAAGCALDHAGSHELGPPSPVAAVATTSLGAWERVVVKDPRGPAERRLLWKLDATTTALDAERGEVPGACFSLPREAVGDALARGFQLAQAIGVAMAIASLLTVILTPPGGALRFLRLLALLGALALGVTSLAFAEKIASKRMALESAQVVSAAVRHDFGVTHAWSMSAGLGEAILVVIALVLALERREAPLAGGPRQVS